MPPSFAGVLETDLFFFFFFPPSTTFQVGNFTDSVLVKAIERFPSPDLPSFPQHLPWFCRVYLVNRPVGPQSRCHLSAIAAGFAMEGVIGVGLMWSAGCSVARVCALGSFHPCRVKKASPISASSYKSHMKLLSSC